MTKRDPSQFAIETDVPLGPVGTRSEGKHTSAVLRKAREAYDEGRHATLDEAVDAFYEMYSGRTVSDEVTEADVNRRIKTKQRMLAKLRAMGSNAPDETA